VKYVLDTNALSRIMKADDSVLQRLEQVGRAAVLVPQPVLAEISYGISRLPRSRRKQDLSTLYARVVQEFERTLWTDEVSARFGETKAWLEKHGKRLEDFDIAIAAHALALDAILVTANSRHMIRIPKLEIEDWQSS
jgi:tRNA(fMet)-specific endonuclease VapC